MDHTSSLPWVTDLERFYCTLITKIKPYLHLFCKNQLADSKYIMTKRVTIMFRFIKYSHTTTHTHTHTHTLHRVKAYYVNICEHTWFKHIGISVWWTLSKNLFWHKGSTDIIGSAFVLWPYLKFCVILNSIIFKLHTCKW